MPVCNKCGESFDVETEPGAQMYGHPESLTQAVPVWKAHICQSCESGIVESFKRKPVKFKVIE